MWRSIGRRSPISVFVVFLKFVAIFQNIDVVACLFGISSGSWRAVPLSMFSSGDLASSVFRRLFDVVFLFFPPGSTQVFDIKLLQNAFLWEFFCVFEGSAFSFVDSLGGSVSVWLLRFLFTYFRLLGHPVAVLLKFCNFFFFCVA